MTASTLFSYLAASSCFAPLAIAQTAKPPLVQKNDPPQQVAPLGVCPMGQTTLCVPLDSTFQVVTFDGPGGNGQADPNDPCQRNDDDVTLAVNLPFTFDLFGQSFTQCFINNNGNISFGSSFPTFTSTGFPVSGFPMVAPFWADVDTRNMNSGVVYFKLETHHLIVIWDHVGYYNEHADLKNTFEVIISDGQDPESGLGNNVCFCYDDMQWTTGDASGGVGGFGGTPATVGVNKGDGVNFFQIGRFGVTGNAYDGPGGNTDGVDYLDHSSFCFFVGQQGNNVPPVYLNPPTECLHATVGVPLHFDIQAIGPEINQTVTISVNSNGLAHFTSSSTAGNPATASSTFTPDASQLGGPYTITFTATDDFTPPASTQLDVCLMVDAQTTTFCAPHSASGTPCPCTVGAQPGHGCENSDHTGGALLATTGNPSLAGDTLVFNCSGEKATALSIVVQSLSTIPATKFGQGITCLGPGMLRLYTKNAVGGAITAPSAGDLPVHSQSAGQGDVLSIGSIRYYQVFYRDPIVRSPCDPTFDTFNSSNGLTVVWGQ